VIESIAVLQSDQMELSCSTTWNFKMNAMWEHISLGTVWRDQLS
jgi:hypothetical protein